jgi:hypothetical protein
MSEIALISARKAEIFREKSASAQFGLTPNKIPVDGSNWNYSYWYPYRYL